MPPTLATRLPHDVYSNIFCEATRSASYRTLSSITGVCKSWRASSICDKLLWRTISSSAPSGWIILSLKRSAPVPLVVVVQLESLSPLLPNRVLALDAISDEMHRVRDLQIIACNPDITRHNIFHRKAPLLVSLSLCDLSSGSLPLRPFQTIEATSR